jgi:hypothetical protein
LFVLGTVGVAGQDDDPGEGVSTAVEDDHDPGDVEAAEDIGADAGDDLSRNAAPEVWQYLSMLVIPWIVNVIIRARWGKDAQTVCMIVVAAVFGIVGAYLRGELDNIQFTTTTVLQLILMVQVSYGVMKRIPGVGDAMRKLEESTGGMPAGLAKADAVGTPTGGP